MIGWFYKVPRDWNSRKFTWISGPVVAAHVDELDGGTTTRTSQVTLQSGDTGTLSTEVATTISRQKFWLKTAKGEQSFTVYGDYNPVYKGERVTVLFYGDIMIAYINHENRRELILEPNLREVTGRPRVGRHLLFCFVAVPVVFAVLITILTVLGSAHVGGSLPRKGVALVLLCSFPTAIWVLVGWFVMYLFYARRRQIVEPKVQKQLRALAGY